VNILTLTALFFSFQINAHSVQDCGTETDENSLRLIAQINTLGVQDLWSKEEAKLLSFCVSEKFQSAYEHMTKVTVQAAEEWMRHANVNFNVVENMSCEDNPREVLFKIVPTSRRARFKARAFFPDSQRRKIQVNRRFSDIPEHELLQLMLHEFGHVLGFRHEHIHPDAGGDCIETGEFEPLTAYDPSSIMHYPTCGKGLNNFVLSDLDKIGASQAYP
jgi:hypothetical protein